jgi:hypothetical protein
MAWRWLPLLLATLTSIDAVPVRIASNGLDSVLLTADGGQDTVVIDTATNFRVERLDAPIERIEIRLINENSSTPLVIGIQKSPRENDEGLVAPTAERSTEMPQTENMHIGNDVVSTSDVTMDNVTPAPEMSQTSSETVIIIRTGPVPESVTSTTELPETTQHTSEMSDGTTITFDALAHEEPSTDGIANNPAEPYNIDDLPLDDAIVDEDSNGEQDRIPVEECLANKDQLPAETVQRMLRQRGRLSHLIRLVNRRQNMFCRPDQQKDQVEYRKCPLWRQEKMVHYYKIMRLTYCSDYSKWPDAPRVKRTFGRDFPLFEKLYAFTQKQ